MTPPFPGVFELDSCVLNNVHLLPSLLVSGVFLLGATASVLFCPVRDPPFESHMIFRVSTIANPVLQRCQKKAEQILGWLQSPRLSSGLSSPPHSRALIPDHVPSQADLSQEVSMPPCGMFLQDLLLRGTGNSKQACGNFL